MKSDALTICAAAALTVLAGCAVGPSFHSPASPATAHYTRTPEPTSTVGAPGRSGGAQTLSTGRDIPADWWTLFHSQALDQLMRQALADSPTVQAASAVLLNAALNYKAQRGALLLPAVNGQASATREREPGAALGEPQIPGFLFNVFDASVNVTYRLDLFGASRRQLEALRAQTDYQRWELEAARLTLADNLVTTAVSIASRCSPAARPTTPRCPISRSMIWRCRPICRSPCPRSWYASGRTCRPRRRCCTSRPRSSELRPPTCTRS